MEEQGDREVAEPRWVRGAPRYAFPSVKQEDGDIARLESHLMHLGRRLFVDVEGLKRAVSCVVYYVNYCSPRAAGFEDLKIAGHFLLVFIFLNDFNDSALGRDFPHVLRAFLACLEGFASEREGVERRWLSVVQELRDDLVERSGRSRVSLSTLLHLMRHAYSAFLWEWRVKGRGVDLSSFQRYRTTTIFNKPWIELWRVLRGLDLDLSVAASPDLAEVEDLAADITYLVNDLVSVMRDVEKKKHNTVLLLREQEGMSIEEAASETRRVHDRKVDRFVALCSKLEAEAPSATLSAYLDLMRIALRGNLQVVVELRQRYDALAPPSPP